MKIFKSKKCILVSLLLILSLMAGSNHCAYAKFLPRNTRLYTPQDYPEYDKYFKNYQKQLEDAFTPEKFFSKKTDYFMSFTFKIRSDGTFADGPEEYIELCYPDCIKLSNLVGADGMIILGN